MNIDRAVIEQAIEALDADCGGRCNAEYNPCSARTVADALRAALAEPQEKVEPGGEYKRGYEDCLAACLLRGEAWVRSMYANNGEHIKPQDIALREAAQEALDALVRSDRIAGWPNNIKTVERLRAALGDKE